MSSGVDLRPPTASCFGDLQCVSADHADGDGVDDPVDHTDRHRDGGVEQRFHVDLFLRADRSEEDLGIAERGLHRGHRIGARDVERGELVGDRRRVGAESADVPLNQSA